jgi:hypothetical protein
MRHEPKRANLVLKPENKRFSLLQCIIKIPITQGETLNRITLI